MDLKKLFDWKIKNKKNFLKFIIKNKKKFLKFNENNLTHFKNKSNLKFVTLLSDKIK